MGAFETARAYCQEAWSETQKVHWPSRAEVRSATLVVLALVSIIAVFLFSVDTILSWMFRSFVGN